MAIGKAIVGVVVLIIVVSSVSSYKDYTQRAEDSARQEEARKAREKLLAAMTPEQRAEIEAKEAERKRLAAEATARLERERAEQKTGKRIKWLILPLHESETDRHLIGLSG